MFTDLAMFTVAIIGLGLQLLAPGYIIGWLTNLLDFRQRLFSTRLLLGLVFSVAVIPVVSYWIGKTASVNLIAWCSSATVVIFAWLLLRERRNIRLINDRWFFITVLLVLIWIGIALASLIDIQIGKRLYFSSIAFDYQTRNLLTDSIFRTGIPPVNPHIYPGAPLFIHYYYFWSILPAALCDLTAGWIDARSATNASTIWSGVSLAAVILLYLRIHTPDMARLIRARSAAALGLLSITGLDIIFATVYIFWFLGNPDIFESWNGNSSVGSWPMATLWAPHHVAALVACLTGYLIFNGINKQSNRKYRCTSTLIGALSLASAAGMSVYVTFIFVVFWIAWLLVCYFQKESRFKIPWLLAMGGIALLVDLPYLLDLLVQRQDVAGTAGFLSFWVRPIQPLQWLLSQWRINQTIINIVNLLLLPLNYLIELGFFLLAGFIFFQKSYRNKAISAYLLPESLLLSISFVISSFFYSSTASTNDLGWRGIMPAQFILLIWSVNILPVIFPHWFSWTTNLSELRLSPLMRKLLISMIVIGFMSSVFALIYQRVFFIITDRYKITYSSEGIPAAWQYGERLYDLRQMASFINQETPREAIIQSYPGSEELFTGINVYLERQAVASAPYHISLYGYSEKQYQPLESKILPIFENVTLPFSDIIDTCIGLGIDYLLVKDIDPVWKEPNSWIWVEKPVFSNKYYRLFDCKR